MIIILNGATSSGKSSIAKSIQYLSDVPWLVLGVDALISFFPHKYRYRGEKAEEGFNFIHSEDQYGTLLSFTMGHYAKNAYFSLGEIASLLDKKGLNIIIDEVLIYHESIGHYEKNFKENLVYFIGVHCDKSTLEEREILRGDRFIGSSRDQIQRVHSCSKKYDLEIDTTHQSPFDCARKILEFIKNEKKLKGF